MPILLFRLLRSTLRSRTWTLPAALIVFVFVTSWPLMALAEPAGAAIVEPANYWWWFLITASTVGYGDFYPVSAGGHAVGVYVIVGGIATLTTLFARLAGAIERAKGRRMRGAVQVDISDHIVVLGYTPARTERIIDELLADGRIPVVLCAWGDIEVHPMPETDVQFVRGDLTDENVLRRAGVHRARSVLIDARDDNESLVMLVTVDHLVDGAHLVVALRDLKRCEHLKYVNDSVRCVQWHSARMISEELLDPGISRVYAELMAHGGTDTYSIRLPQTFDAVPFGELQVALGSRYDATVLATDGPDGLLVSPAWRATVTGGTVLYYVCRQRLAVEQIHKALEKG